MRKLTKEVTIELLAYYELAVIEQTLLQRACQVRLNAQAPYSHYWVGCSLVTDGDLIFDGCNVENVNWSETVHAEENAISNTVSHLDPFRIRMMAVVGAPENQIIAWPPKKTCSPSIRYSKCRGCLPVLRPLPSDHSRELFWRERPV